MKASISLLAVLLTLSFTSLAQTAPVQETVPVQETTPAQQAAPVQQAAPAQATAPTAPTQQAAPTQQTAPAQEMAPAQQTAPAQQAAGGESAKPEAQSQASTASPSPAASTPSTETTAASASAVPAVAIAPGAKLFLEPMDGFDQFLARAFVTKKTPVVVVKDRAEADFVVSGDTRLKKPGWFTGMVLADHGKGEISIADAHTGSVVWTNKFSRVNQMTTDYYIYQGWAEACAKHLRQMMEKKTEKK